MRRTLLCGLLAFLFVASPIPAQTKLSPKWEELTAADFRQGIQQSKGTCLLPFGILEKHGAHLPLGTDLLNVRYASLHAVEQEYAVVFPEYYFGQIFEAKHEPGTVAYSMELQLKLLQETTDEMARNGCKKIIIVNGHGGNVHLLPYFAQAQMDKPHDYVVYVLDGERSRPGGPAKKSSGIDYHAGENESSTTLFSHPISSTWIAPLANPAPTRSARIFPNFSTRASGGTRVSPITIPGTAQLPRTSLASGTCRGGFQRLSWRFAP
jgi:creatinine amidohydrolase